jgi:hypothetical protein
VSHSNVVPFDPARRDDLARRGAPDKIGAATGELVKVECPGCASQLRIAADWLAGLDEVLCGRCDAEIVLVPRRERGAG